MDTLSPQDHPILNGRDVLRDPGAVQLRRYLPVLAVVAAPRRRASAASCVHGALVPVDGGSTRASL